MASCKRCRVWTSPEEHSFPDSSSTELKPCVGLKKELLLTWNPGIPVRIVVEENFELVASSGVIHQPGRQFLGLLPQDGKVVLELGLHHAQMFQLAAQFESWKRGSTAAGQRRKKDERSFEKGSNPLSVTSCNFD